MQQSINERIKELLKSKRYTINSLAKETGVLQQTLNKQIMGQSTMSVDTIIKIASIIDNVFFICFSSFLLKSTCNKILSQIKSICQSFLSFLK